MIFYLIKTKMVTLVIAERRETVPFHTARGSEYIKGLLDDMGSDAEVFIPDKYHKVIDIYINFLRDSSNEVTNGKEIALCFDMYSYFLHDDYFPSVLKLAYDNWSEFYPHLKDLNRELREEIYLYTPYKFLPEAVVNNPIFFQSWLKQNQDKIITLNNVNIHRNEVEYSESGRLLSFSTYHTVVGLAITYKFIKSWSIGTGKPWWDCHYYNGKKNGLFREWSHDGILITECYWENDATHGSYKEWYYNGKSKIEGLHQGGLRCGIWKSWDEDGNPYPDKHYP